MVITASDSCMTDMLRTRADMTPGFYRQEAALECLPTGIQGRASAESPLAQGLASLKSSCHFFSASRAVGSVLSLLVHCHAHNSHVGRAPVLTCLPFINEEMEAQRGHDPQLGKTESGFSPHMGQVCCTFSHTWCVLRNV